jgi:hypothetical protein
LQAVPKLAGVIAGLAIIASEAGVCAQQTEQLSLPNLAVTAPAAPVAAPAKRMMQDTVATARRTTV